MTVIGADPVRLAAGQFDAACRLIRTASGRRVGNSELGRRLGEVAGRATLSRQAVGGWRNAGCGWRGQPGDGDGRGAHSAVRAARRVRLERRRGAGGLAGLRPPLLCARPGVPSDAHPVHQG